MVYVQPYLEPAATPTEFTSQASETLAHDISHAAGNVGREIAELGYHIAVLANSLPDGDLRFASLTIIVHTRVSKAGTRDKHINSRDLPSQK